MLAHSCIMNQGHAQELSWGDCCCLSLGVVFPLPSHQCSEKYPSCLGKGSDTRIPVPSSCQVLNPECQPCHLPLPTVVFGHSAERNISRTLDGSSRVQTSLMLPWDGARGGVTGHPCRLSMWYTVYTQRPCSEESPQSQGMEACAA